VEVKEGEAQIDNKSKFPSVSTQVNTLRIENQNKCSEEETDLIKLDIEDEPE